jgi:signal peptidase
VEIAPVPHRPPPDGRWRLVLALVVLAPVIALVLLPAGLGLDRHLVTDDSMSGTMGRGSLVMAREVPSGDLRVGDVISYQVPHHGGRVTHRIVTIDRGVATTRGDNSPAVDPWRLSLDDPTYARVLFHVPWIGYLFVANGDQVLMGATVAALLLALVVSLRLRARSWQHDPPRAPASVSSRGKVGVG